MPNGNGPCEEGNSREKGVFIHVDMLGQTGPFSRKCESASEICSLKPICHSVVAVP